MDRPIDSSRFVNFLKKSDTETKYAQSNASHAMRDF